MEKFAVDLDKVLDEFEFNEGENMKLGPGVGINWYFTRNFEVMEQRIVENSFDGEKTSYRISFVGDSECRICVCMCVYEICD